MTHRRAVGWWVAAVVIGVLTATPVTARDAAFMQPGASNSADDNAVKIDPKSEIDVGETSVNTARRTTLFFVNQSNVIVQIEKISVNSDANVLAEITGDDCSKQGSIAPQSRCSVEVSIKPTNSGTWNVEVIMTHNGVGRIARAHLTGKTTGAGGEGKETGLSVSSKEATPVTFGEVAENGKAARSALMVNDSPDAITLYSIDVIEADNGLKILDSGCSVDMELKPGESCPVTMVWEPTQAGQISTDLIIRHSGRKGFAVVPVRGKTKGYDESGPEASKTETKTAPTTVQKSPDIGPPPTGAGLQAPPTADDLEKAMAGKIPQTSSSELKKSSEGTLRLIGTVGNRAVLLLPDGTTKVADLNDQIDIGDGNTAKVISIDARSVEVTIDGKSKKLALGSAPELIEKAAASAAADKSKSSSKSSSSSSSKSSSKSEKSSSVSLPSSHYGGRDE